MPTPSSIECTAIPTQSAIIFIWNLYACAAAEGCWTQLLLLLRIIRFWFIFCLESRTEEKKIIVCVRMGSVFRTTQKSQLHRIVDADNGKKCLFRFACDEWARPSTSQYCSRATDVTRRSHDHDDLTCDNFSISTFLFDGVDWFIFSQIPLYGQFHGEHRPRRRTQCGCIAHHSPSMKVSFF